jgi:hypothetical protein
MQGIETVDKNSKRIIVYKNPNMDMPTLAVVYQLLRLGENFIAKTRFDRGNMTKLWTVCQSRPKEVKLADFLKSRAVSEIFREAPSNSEKKRSRLSSAVIFDPTSFERTFSRSEEVMKNEAKLFEDIANFPRNSDSHCSEFLSRAAGSPSNLCYFFAIAHTNQGQWFDFTFL